MKTKYAWLIAAATIGLSGLAATNKAIQIPDISYFENVPPDITAPKFCSALRSGETAKHRAPAIRSEWHATNWLHDIEPQAWNIASRHFGSAIFKRIEEWNVEMRSAKLLAPNATNFLDIADWLMQTPAYGNYFIALRCHEFAADGIGHALADANCSLTATTNLFPRFDVKWKTATARAKILRDDFAPFADDVPGGVAMVELAGDEATQQKILDGFWVTAVAMGSRLDPPRAMRPLVVPEIGHRDYAMGKDDLFWGPVPNGNYNAETLMSSVFGGNPPSNTNEIREALAFWLKSFHDFSWNNRREPGDQRVKVDTPAELDHLEKSINSFALHFLLESMARFKHQGKIDVQHWDVMDDEALCKGPSDAQIVALKNLASFRAVTSGFPTEQTFTPEELELNADDIASAKNRGIATPRFEDVYQSKQQCAFVRAWAKYCKANPTVDHKSVDAMLAYETFKKYSP